MTTGKQAPPTKIEQCSAWLLATLQTGPRSLNDLVEKGAQLGYDISVIQRARSLLTEGTIIDTKGAKRKGNLWALREDTEAQQARMARILDLLTGSAKAGGAEGVWIFRGIKDSALIFGTGSFGAADEDTDPPELKGVANLGQTFEFEIADADILVLMRFPTGDGQEPGIEHH